MRNQELFAGLVYREVARPGPKDCLGNLNDAKIQVNK
jgi:hypothetical protein